MERKQVGMNDILPRELIRRIFLRVPAKDLFRLRFVSKLWHSFISDPDFAELHYNLYSAVSSRSYLLVKDYTSAYCVHLDRLFDVAAAPPTLKEVSLPSRKKPYPHFRLLGSCRGFVLLKEKPDFLVIWNPVTGSSKTISYSHIKVPRDDSIIRYGFGFDASRDDYLIVLSWHDYYIQHGLVCFSLRTNSWIDLDAALPETRVRWKQKLSALFLHGAIHWLCYSSRDHIEDGILIFDLKERSFSTISMPTQLVGCYPIYLITLGGCLALYSDDKHKTEIWVMKEYKVPSSWILMYDIPYGNNLPLCMSNGSDIIALNFTPRYCKIRFAKYNVSGELLNYSPLPLSEYYYFHRSFSVYTGSLFPFPCDIKDRDKKKKTGQECFEQRDVAED
ncbi:F-box/kelch-repeat protein At3g23880-like [Arachis ipaensis]|uniref:F-box/kelch-repeat protein At3g23880-like n=1 Tax=Arachis ipaensis TaxID=130454 RepID=UPI000A2B4875|nr:F-box/kelch-repeat protein At3g23880-like [Arachis ipaensis]XP_025645039.1 F-box/kelch-repeat protein At3g23880-like [Arachis hypogaea]